MVYSRPARCFRIVKFSCVGQSIHLVLQILNLGEELTHRRRISRLLHGESTNFSIVWLFFLFIRNRFFMIPQFLGNLLRDFLGRVYFSFPSLQINGSFLFEPDLPMSLLIEVHSLRFKFSIGFIESNVSISLFPISFVHFCLSLRKYFLSCAFSLNSQSSFLFKVDLEISPFGQSLHTFQISVSGSYRQSPCNT